MSFHEFFRSLFGFPRHNDSHSGENVFKDSSGLWDEIDNPDEREIFDNFHSFNFGFSTMEPFQMFRQMEEMFRDLTFGDFPHNSIEHPLFGQESIEDAPRDKMLKLPDEDCDPKPRVPLFRDWGFSPSNLPPVTSRKEDIDLDEKVASGGLDQVLADRNETSLQPHSHSFHKFVSVQTVQGADGKIERRKTVRDSEGNEETIVSRSIGDQTHSVTMKTDKEGIKEKKEDFINLEESSLKEFDMKWKEQKQLQDTPMNEIKPFNDGHSRDPLYFPIFSRLFGFDPRQH